jgi:hypothetical protein
MSSSSPGHPGTPLPESLGIAAGMRVAVLHAPEWLDETLRPLPEDVTVQHGLRRGNRVDLVLGFVTEQAHLAGNIGWITQTLPPQGAFWVAWPDPTSKLQTDMSEDAVREVALPLGWVGTNVRAIGTAWSGLELVRGG